MSTTDLTGQLLIALPSLEDPNFKQSVVYLCQHNEEGALGVVLTKPSSLTLGEICDRLEIENHDPELREIPVFFGGPVQSEQGLVLYSAEKLWEPSLAITEEIALTNSREILEDLVRGEGPQQYRVVLGHAGWGPGQLEAELREDAWLTAPTGRELVFETPFTDLWERAAASIGVDMSLLIQESGHA